MKKETKADREARLAAEQVVLDTQRSEVYLSKLMISLEAATKRYYYSLSIKDGKFILIDRGRDWDNKVELSPTYNRNDWETLQDLEYALELKEKAYLEDLRKETVKRGALAKLSDEERELLGL